MSFEQGYLASHPLPTGIVGALGIGGYQLLADVAGVGAGRLGSHIFLLVAADPDPNIPDPGTQIRFARELCAGCGEAALGGARFRDLLARSAGVVKR